MNKGIETQIDANGNVVQVGEPELVRKEGIVDIQADFVVEEAEPSTQPKKKDRKINIQPVNGWEKLSNIIADIEVWKKGIKEGMKGIRQCKKRMDLARKYHKDGVLTGSELESKLEIYTAEKNQHDAYIESAKQRIVLENKRARKLDKLLQQIEII